MGASKSKAARAAGSTARKYPARPSPNTNMPSSGPPPVAARGTPGPTVHPQPTASTERSDAINLDAADPDFAKQLRSLGAVQPNPTQSPSSRFGDMLANKGGPALGMPSQAARGPPVGPDPRNNPALTVLAARQRWQAEADREFGESGRGNPEGRTLVDVSIIRQALVLRDGRNLEPAKIEDMLELKRGMLKKLGPKGVVKAAEMGID